MVLRRDYSLLCKASIRPTGQKPKIKQSDERHRHLLFLNLIHGVLMADNIAQEVLLFV